MSWPSWTGFWGVTDYLQGYEQQAKQSTRFLARGASAVACNVDLSQYLTDLSTNVTYCFEATTTRFNYSHPRTMGWRLEMDDADTGLLIRHGAGANTETFGFSAANTLRVQVANVVIWTQALTVLSASPTNEEVIVTWRSRANPDTTGAADAVLSRVDVWNVDAGTHEAFDLPAHVTKALSSATAVIGANTHPAGTPFSGTMTAFWYENRYQSGAEIANDWVANVTAPTTELETIHQGIPPEADTLDLPGFRAGPAYVWAADATRRLIRRCHSPVWNDQLNVRPTWSAALLAAVDPMIRGTPGDGDWRMHGAGRALVPIPDTASHLWIRIHVRSWTTSGAAVPLGMRAYSFNRLPGAALPPADQGGPDPLETYSVGELVTRDDDASDGEYTAFDLLPIARGRTGDYAGKTVLAIAFQIDPNASSGNDANARFMLRAVHALPVFAEIPGGLDFSEGAA
jgi:hypothetical protein